MKRNESVRPICASARSAYTKKNASPNLITTITQQAPPNWFDLLVKVVLDRHVRVPPTGGDILLREQSGHLRGLLLSCRRCSSFQFEWNASDMQMTGRLSPFRSLSKQLHRSNTRLLFASVGQMSGVREWNIKISEYLRTPSPAKEERSCVRVTQLSLRTAQERIDFEKALPYCQGTGARASDLGRPSGRWACAPIIPG